MSYYKKASLSAILCALLVVVAAVLVLAVGMPAKAPFSDSAVLTVKCADIPLDYTKLETQLASATKLPYTVTAGKDISGTYEAASVKFDGTGFTAVNAQELVATLGASYSVISYDTVAGKNTTGLVMFLVFTGVTTFIIAGLYLAIRYGLKTALTSFVPAVAAVAGALITLFVIGGGVSYPLAVVSVGSFAAALFFAALAFGQARELHEAKHVLDHDDVADKTGEVLMPRNIRIALAAVLVLGAAGVSGLAFGLRDLAYTAFPLLIGTLIGLFGAQFCAVPLCMSWQEAEDEAAVKKAHEKKPAKKHAKATSGKPAAKTAKSGVKTPAKKSAKKTDPAKTGKAKPKK